MAEAGLALALLSLAVAAMTPLWQRRLARVDVARRVTVTATCEPTPRDAFPEKFEIRFRVHNGTGNEIRHVKIGARLAKTPDMHAPQHRRFPEPDHLLGPRQVRKFRSSGFQHIPDWIDRNYFNIGMVGTAVVVEDGLSSNYDGERISAGETTFFRQSSMVPDQLWRYQLSFTDGEGRSWYREVGSRRVKRAVGAAEILVLCVVLPPVLIYEVGRVLAMLFIGGWYGPRKRSGRR